MEIEKQRDRLSGAERWLSLAAGGAALVYGLRRRSWLRAAIAVAGVRYAAHGITGHRHVRQYLGLSAPTRTASYGSGVKIRRSVTINRSPQELYQFWRNFENLPRFMKNLKSVRSIDQRRSHWETAVPNGTKWDAEIVAERENELIGWRSTSGNLDHAGSVRFEKLPGDRGTVVRVQMQYNPPGGVLTATLAKLLGAEPDQQIKEALTAFKETMETGEVPTTEGQPSGREEDKRRMSARDWEPRRIEVVEEASRESFPASDAPSWTAGGGH